MTEQLVADTEITDLAAHWTEHHQTIGWAHPAPILLADIGAIADVTTWRPRRAHRGDAWSLLRRTALRILVHGTRYDAAEARRLIERADATEPPRHDMHALSRVTHIAADGLSVGHVRPQDAATVVVVASREIARLTRTA